MFHVQTSTMLDVENERIRLCSFLSSLKYINVLVDAVFIASLFLVKIKHCDVLK